MKKVKTICIAVLVFALLGGGFFLYTKYSGSQDASSLTEDAGAPIETPPPPTNYTTIRIPDKSAKPVYSAADFAWIIENAPDFEETLPKQNVILSVKGKSYPAGTSMGCTIANAMSDLVEGELARQTCWFAGAGDEFIVVKEGDIYVAKHRWIQESEGDEEDVETEGPWEKLFVVE